MSTTKLFVICGLSRLTARVCHSLVNQGHRVSVIIYDGDKQSLKMILPASSTVYTATAENAAATLTEAGIAEAECMLALSEDDAANLRSTVSARSVVHDVPVVMRAFDPLLAEQFEKGFGVRRAYSVSALAAPAFIAAAAGSEMLGSLRLGFEIVPFCRITISPDSPLLGKDLKTIENNYSVSVIASKISNQDWKLFTHSQTAAIADKNAVAFSARRINLSSSDPSKPKPQLLNAGDEILIGGTTTQALTLCAYSAGWFKQKGSSSMVLGGRGTVGKGSKKRPVSGARKSQTYLPIILMFLIVCAIISTFVFATQLNLSLIDAIYFTMTTMVTIGDGDIDVGRFPQWLKLYQCLVMINGGALLGVSFSYLTSFVTAERTEVTMARQAERMRGHVIVVGLGNVGYRVTQALADLGLDIVAVDLAPPPRFYDSISSRAPVLTGDARLSDFLHRVAITDAEAIIACTSNDVANVETCLHARRLNPKIRTLARVFENKIVGTVAEAFAIDSVLSATSVAESAFVIAANDVNSVLTFKLGDLELSALRYRAPSRIVESEVRAWQAAGLILPTFHSEKDICSSTLGDDLTYEVIAIGTDATIRKLLAHEIPPYDPAEGAVGTSVGTR